MNDQQSFEREVATWITAEGATSTPDQTLDDILTATGRKRPLPSWLALIKEPPMRISSSLAVGSPTARVAAIMVATLLITLMVAGAGIAGSRLLAADGTIVVDQSGSGDFTTITEAVAMAEDGDTILVRPGIYDESVLLTKDVTIRGDGDRDAIIVELSQELGPSRTVTRHDPDLPTAFLFEDSDATLEHLTVRGEPSRIVVRGGAPVLQDLLLDGLGRICCPAGRSTEPTGLTIMEASTATIKDNDILDTAIDFILDADPTVSKNVIRGGGFWMQGNGVDPIIRENSMDAIDGLAIWGGARPTVESNTITNGGDGIGVQNAGHSIADTGTDPVIRGNTVSGTEIAISVGPYASATIADNVLIENGAGIDVRSDALIEGNRVEGGDNGIVVVGASPSLVDNTVVGTSGQGILIGFLAAFDTSPTLSGNTSCDNGENLKIEDGATPDIDDTNEICEDAAEPSE